MRSNIWYLSKASRGLQNGELHSWDSLRTYGSQHVFRDSVNDHYKACGRVCGPGYALVVGEENVSAGARVTWHPKTFPGPGFPITPTHQLAHSNVSGLVSYLFIP